MLIAQISDLHISLPDSTNETLLRTSAHLARAVEHLNNFSPRPDVVLATGDLVERGHPDEYAILKRVLAPLEIPLYVIPGNHDARASLRAAFPDHPWSADGFLHYVVDRWPVRLIGLDTIVPGAPGGNMCSERLAWLDARLAEAPDRPTVLFMHHPPFVTGLQAMDAMGLDGKPGFAAVVARHPQVERIVCGHVHRPISRRLAGTVVSTCPSTAHQLNLDLPPSRQLALVMEPPACALHLWLGPEAGLVSHLSAIASGRPPLVLHDGERWLPAPHVPADFHPPG